MGQSDRSLAVLGGTPEVEDRETYAREIPWERIIQEVDGYSLFDGDTVERFEQTMAEFVGTNYALSAASGTSAIEIAMLAVWRRLDRRPSVVLPACCYPSVYQIAYRYDLDITVVDNDINTMSIDPGAFAEIASDNHDVVVVPHPMGITAEMAPIAEVAREHNIQIIEDVGYSLGATYDGESAGSFGIGCIPLSQGKSLVTGEGGMITTDDSDVYRRARLSSHVGMSIEPGQSVLETGWFDPIEHSRDMDFDAIGVSARMSSLQAGAGLANIESFKDRSEAASKRFSILNGALEDIDGLSSLVNRAYGHDSSIQSNERFLLGYVDDAEIPRDLLVYCMMEEGTPIKPRKKYAFSYSYSDTILPERAGEEFPSAKYYSERNIFLPIKPEVPVDYYRTLGRTLEKCVSALRDPGVREQVYDELDEYINQRDRNR